MTKRLYSLLLLLLLAIYNTSAQDYLVSYVAGKVQTYVNGKASVVKLNAKLKQGTIINVPYEGKLELLDEKNCKRYTIVKPGKSTVQAHISATGNSTMNITARYLSYIKKQLASNDSNGKLQRAQVYTDYATVTRELLVFEEIDEKQEQDSILNTLSPRERVLAKRSLNHKRHDAFRDSVIQHHIEFVRKAWQGRDVQEAENKPIFKEIGPKVQEFEGEATDKLKIAAFFKGVFSSKKDKNRVILPDQMADRSKPQPLLDIQENIPLVPDPDGYLPFEYFGTEMKVRLSELNRVNIGTISPDRIADVLERLSNGKYDNLIYDCLQLRETHNLNDWAYFEMLQTLSETFFGVGTNEATLLLGFLAYQSGYSIRFATDAESEHLYFLINSKHIIYGQPFYFGKDKDERFYVFGKDVPKTILMCDADFPNERGLSFFIDKPLLLDAVPTTARQIQGYRYKDNVVTVSTNRNLISFYDTYPASQLSSNVCTLWAMYANTPLNPEVREELYPQLKALLAGKKSVDQVHILMDLIHGIPYEYDNQVWGDNRIFFAEETLYYPVCDCEDRAILLARWVRDLVGLKCALVYYPGHLATAIQFDIEVKGDKFEIDGVPYIVCDPTYLGSYIGMQMPGTEPDKAQLIILE